ncbi:hypothetical protein L9F63_026640, partial [Diploptera punctata]
LVVGTTCLGAGHALFTRRTFDICIVDESTQVLQVSVLRPLFCAKKFVLIGDPEQLPPVVRSKRAKELGMSESLFARLDSPDVTVCLNLQYRMNQAITDVANELTYNGQLKCGNEETSLATLELPNENLVMDELAEESWLRPILSSSLQNSFVMLDTGPTCRTERGYTNLFEAAVIHRVVRLLIKAGVVDSGIGIIAPYRAQVALLRKVVSADAVEVNTVDQYQGRDKDVIIFSCTKSVRNDYTENNKSDENEILGDKRRLTVAVTRAKKKLIIIGDVITLRKYSPFNQLLECLSHSSVIRDNKLNRRTKVKRRNRSDKGNFEPADVSEYITPLHPPPSHARDEPLRYSAHELFLPDTSLIFGRLLLCAWEQGMEGAEESAAEIIIIAVQQFLKNILMTVLSRRKGYKLRENRFMYNLGTAVPNPWLRNTANIADDSMNNRGTEELIEEEEEEEEQEEEKSQPVFQRLSLEEIEQRAAYQIACSNTVPTTHYPVTPFQLLEALQVNRNMIPSHTVYSLNTERIITSLNHPTTEEIEATSK